MFPFLPLVPLGLFAIAVAISGLSYRVYKLVNDKKVTVVEKLEKLEEMKASGKIKPEEYEKARQMVLDKFAHE